ncbi:hypothetical protein [Pseudomonas citri]|uniref:hypothetical protein n=1 Tax=Pseudomonas citri TaxID=2978349 RepID=UPI0021B52A8A|nr:hypothetical protein [Pseudomonas citri]
MSTKATAFASEISQGVIQSAIRPLDASKKAGDSTGKRIIQAEANFNRRQLAASTRKSKYQ